MLNVKNNHLVKAIAIVVLSAVVWTVGYLSGLEIGQKRAEQKLSQENQNQNKSDSRTLPQIPAISNNQTTGQSNVLPQIPQVK